MKRRTLGRTAISITELGLGGWGLGGVYYGAVPREQGVAAVKAYLDCGGNHLDTAYSYHSSEEVIGEAIRGYDRGSLVLASKTYAGSFDDESTRDIRTDLEISLRDLGTDYVDIYYLHGSPSEPDRMNRILDVYEKLKAEGKIRAIGASIRGPNVDDESLRNALQYIGSGRIQVVELAYSILRQQHAAAFPAAAEAGVGIVARVVLESGLITGKYQAGHRFRWPDQRCRYGPELDAIFAEAARLRELLPPGYASTTELATRFVLSRPEVSGVILGGTHADQFRRTCAMDTLPSLPPSLLKELELRYAGRSGCFNPTGTLEHVDSPRIPLSTPL